MEVNVNRVKLYHSRKKTLLKMFKQCGKICVEGCLIIAVPQYLQLAISCRTALGQTQGGYALPSICLSVCLSVSNFTYKPLIGT